MMDLSRRLQAWVCAALAVLALPGAALAQAGKDEKPIVELSTRVAPPSAQAPAQLVVTARIAQGWHIYSTTTPEGGPLATIIKVDPANTYKLAGELRPDKAPTKKHEEAFDDVPFVEYHEGTVTWQAPLEVAAGANPAALKVTGMFRYQACDAKSCMPPKIVKFTALPPKQAELQPKVHFDSQVQTVAGESELPPAGVLPKGGLENSPAKELIGDLLPSKSLIQATPAAGGYRAKRTNTTLRGFLEPAIAQPGDTVTLSLTAEPNLAEHYHVYELRAKPRPAGETGNQPTLIVVTDKSGLVQGPTTPSAEPEIPAADRIAAGELPYYTAPATWTIKFEIPADATPGPRRITGVIGYQSCSTSCDQPSAAKFEGTINVAAERAAGRLPLEFTREAYGTAAALANGVSPSPTETVAPAPPGTGTEKIAVETAPAPTEGAPKAPAGKTARASAPPDLGSILVTLGMAFLGGVILNVMPCVLPVIGLKLLSFVQQGGENRMRVFTLNVWYSAGVLFVFMILAGLAVFTGLGWGQQNNNVVFNVAMASVVFVFALSLLGVWEIPVPGFVGSSEGMQNLAAKEGELGAFSKGILTTLLATPCSGPFLGVVFAWAAAQPAYLAFATFACTGLGMASPYLLIGAFPRLIRFLPKPGAWMDTFKQAMGFVLLGTVAYMLTYISWHLVAPTVAFLIGLWAACWWIGRTPVYADGGAKFRAWAFGIAFATVVWGISFQWLAEIMEYRFDQEVDLRIARHDEKMEKLNPWQRLVEQRQLKLNQIPLHVLPFQSYTPSRLALLRDHNVTVLLDFTAVWCAQCQVNKASALNTLTTRKLVEENQVFTLIVDITHDNPDAYALMDQLQTESIPFYAIYPAGGGDPLILRDVITAGEVKDALVKAGPSKLPGQNPATMTQMETAKAQPKPNRAM